MIKPENSGVRWQKVLWKQQPFPDNYVPESFLEHLVTNANLRPVALLPMVLNALTVAQQMSAVILFGIVFQYCQDSPHSDSFGTFITSCDARVMFLDGVILLIGLLATQGRHVAFSGRWLRNFVLFVALMRVGSPLLRTLTTSYSDDTIYALAVALAAVHLTTHDYATCAINLVGRVEEPMNSRQQRGGGEHQIGGGGQRPVEFSGEHHRYQRNQSTNAGDGGDRGGRGALSLNAAMFAAVLLASRLHSNERVFGLMVLAVELFALLPEARCQLSANHSRANGVVTVILSAGVVTVTSILLALRAWGEAMQSTLVAYGFAVVLITLVCPLCLVHIQKRKLNIQGPWDIAHVIEDAAG